MSSERKRESKDDYFMGIATKVATRATCDRLHVGAVIVVNGTIVSTGYNGSPRRTKHCDDPNVGHLLKDMGGRKSCVRTAHAEVNALVQAARTGAAVEGGILYTTASPCYDCMKYIINAGIVRVICGAPYGSRYGLSEDSTLLAQEAGLEVSFLSEVPLETKEEKSIA